MCDINSFYEELEGELDEKTKEILDKVKEKIDSDPAYRLHLVAFTFVKDA